jgi:glycosyltransferase involved in cell wall biosynthesis
MSKPFITVLVDTYNHKSFIGDAINSVLRQDIEASETEILVVDDGSTDGTDDVVRKFAPRVQLLRKLNGGQASAFNLGISEARGELVAFLDGDDWWAPGKLAAVAKVFASDKEVGLVGHGITEIHSDGRQRVEVPRDVCRFRLTSGDAAKRFRMQRGFLGTSRMTYRRQILHRIGPVPGALRFEADEYLFTLAGLFADVLILNESFTFYRLHDGNLFQITNGDRQALRRKQQVLTALAESLRKKLEDQRVPVAIARPILECVEVEADVLRLKLDSGFPWETVSTELRIMRVFHGEASLSQWLFTCARLIFALVLPARTYYQWRSRLSSLTIYQDFRRKAMPFPVPSHVERTDKPAP